MSRPLLGLSLVTAVLFAACGSSSPTTSPNRSAPPVASAAASMVGPGASIGSAAGQTDSAWGRIWDTLPAGFPAIRGSSPADTGDGPASATLVVKGDSAKTIATSMQVALEAAGFRTQGLSGPLEDGTYVLDSVGAPAGCKVQVTASPLGGLTRVTVMYGAVCPHG